MTESGSVMSIAALAAATQRLYGLSREQGYCDVLVDPLAAFSLSDEVAALEGQGGSRTFLKDPLFKAKQHEAPCLLRIPMAQWHLVELLATIAHQEATDPDNNLRSVCGFLHSGLATNQLSAKLTAALDLQVPGRRIYFRYFDPRCVLHLPRLLPADTLAGVFHGISRWSYFVWDGALATLEMPPQESSALFGRLQLTRAQWSAFAAIEHFNAAQKLLVQLGFGFTPAQTPDVFASVQDAIGAGLSDPADVAHYVACCKKWAIRISEHTAWPEVLTLTRAGVPIKDALPHCCGIELPAA